jgi:hypothetical protein
MAYPKVSVDSCRREEIYRNHLQEVYILYNYCRDVVLGRDDEIIPDIDKSNDYKIVYVKYMNTIHWLKICRAMLSKYSSSFENLSSAL